MLFGDRGFDFLDQFDVGDEVGQIERIAAPAFVGLPDVRRIAPSFGLQEHVTTENHAQVLPAGISWHRALTGE